LIVSNDAAIPIASGLRRLRRGQCLCELATCVAKNSHAFLARVRPQIASLLPRHKLVNVWADRIEALACVFPLTSALHDGALSRKVRALPKMSEPAITKELIAKSVLKKSEKCLVRRKSLCCKAWDAATQSISKRCYR
jgi:hypothetical protein